MLSSTLFKSLHLFRRYSAQKPKVLYTRKHTRMFMSTKTLTIMEDAYRLLADNKLEDESFSEEIRRVFSKKKTKKLIDFFGILSEKEGADILKELERSRKIDIKLDRKRIK